MPTSCEIKHDSAVQEFLGQIDTSTPYIDSVYYDRIEPLFKQYQNSVSADSTRSADNALLISNTARINQFVASEIANNPNFISLYPNLYTRIQTSPLITPAEVQTVTDTSILTIDTVGDYLTPYTPLIPSLLDDYYGPGAFSGSGMKSFCSLVPNIFAAYTDLMNAFNDIKSFANKFNNILSAIQEFSLAGLLEGLKKQALAIIDGIVAKVRAKINEITGLFSRVANFKINLNNVFTKMHQEKQKVDEVLSEPSIDNLKAAVEGSISFASSLFEELKIEEIQFIILRFCELISGIENFFDDLIKPLEDIPNNFKRSFEFLSSAGYGGTSRAVAAGAFRVPSNQRAAGATAVDGVSPNIVGGEGVTFSDEGFAVQGGIAVRRRAYRVNPITAEELAILNNELTFENVSKDRSDHIHLLLGRSYAIDGIKVWTNVAPVEKTMLYRLSLKLGRKLIVNSAFRSSFAQSQITGKDSGSWHISGQAFDVRMSSYSGMNFETFKGYANSEGFSRVRPYPESGFVHIDTGPPSQMW
jgi:hypothetical protein